LAYFCSFRSTQVPSGAAAAWIVLLLVLKHLGLLVAFGVPITGFVRNHILPRLKRRQSDR